MVTDVWQLIPKVAIAMKDVSPTFLWWQRGGGWRCRAAFLRRLPFGFLAAVSGFSSHVWGQPSVSSLLSSCIPVFLAPHTQFIKKKLQNCIPSLPYQDFWPSSHQVHVLTGPSGVICWNEQVVQTLLHTRTPQCRAGFKVDQHFSKTPANLQYITISEKCR